jgi:hypothetical protein
VPGLVFADLSLLGAESVRAISEPVRVALGPFSLVFVRTFTDIFFSPTSAVTSVSEFAGFGAKLVFGGKLTLFAIPISYFVNCNLISGTTTGAWFVTLERHGRPTAEDKQDLRADALPYGRRDSAWAPFVTKVNEKSISSVVTGAVSASSRQWLQ